MVDRQIHLWQTRDPDPTKSFHDLQCQDLGVIAGGIPVDRYQPTSDRALGRHESFPALEQFYLDLHHVMLLDLVPSESARMEFVANGKCHRRNHRCQEVADELDARNHQIAHLE